jgi:hypothetical protein
MRPQGQGQCHHFGRRRHFEIQRHEKLPLEALHVEIADMPPILPQMRRDTVGSGEDGEMGGPDRIRIRATARIPHGSHVVDVHAEAKWWSCHEAFLTHRRFLPTSTLPMPL